MSKKNIVYDTIVLGAGPAGLTSGIYALRIGLDILVIESGIAGGRILEASWIENYPGFPEPISGQELAKRIISQFEKFGGKKKLNEEAVYLSLQDEVKTVRTRKGIYKAKTVIIATGAQKKKLFIPGEKDFLGRGVSYCALCDGPFFQQKKVAIIGCDDEAVEDALSLSRFTLKTLFITNGLPITASNSLLKRLKEKPNIEIIEKKRIEAILGEKSVKSLTAKDMFSGEFKNIEVDAIFISIGVIPTTELLRETNIRLDEKGFIEVDRWQRTNLRGVFAAGDCTNGGMQVVTSVGQGAMAAISASKEIKTKKNFI